MVNLVCAEEVAFDVTRVSELMVEYASWCNKITELKAVSGDVRLLGNSFQIDELHNDLTEADNARRETAKELENTLYEALMRYDKKWR
jgi:hypothetical protein